MKLIWKIIIFTVIVAIPFIPCLVFPIDKIIQWLWITPFHEIKTLWMENNTVDWQDLIHTFFPLRGILNVVFLLGSIVFFFLYFKTEKEHYWMKIIGIIGLFPIVITLVYLLIILLFGFLGIFLEMIKLFLRALLPLLYLVAGVCFIKSALF